MFSKKPIKSPQSNEKGFQIKQSNENFNANETLETSSYAKISMFDKKLIEKDVSPYKKNANRIKIIASILVLFLIVAIIALTATIISLFVTNNLKQSQTTTLTTIKTTETTTIKSSSTIITTTTNQIVTENKTCPYGFTKAFCDECGKSFAETNVRVQGGSNAYQFSWPSLALLVFKYKFFYTISSTTYEASKQIICGGTLIDRKTVLTSAACYQQTVTYVHSGTSYTTTVVTNSFHPTIESMYRIYLGLYDNTYVLSQLSDQSLELNNFIIHPNYDLVSQQNDIAIIKLKTEAKLGKSIQPACLPDPTKTSYPQSTNIDSWTAGWGNLNDNFNTPTSLVNNVKITIYPTTSCNNVETSKSKDWARQLCAGDVSGARDACNGDEGGPLFVKDAVNGYQKFILVGITSYAQGCAVNSLARIYTKVSYYLDWISQYQ